MGNHWRVLVRRVHGSRQNDLSAPSVQNGLWEERRTHGQATLVTGTVLQAGNDGGLDQGGGRGDGKKWTHAGYILEIGMAGHAEALDVGDEGQKGRNKACLRHCSYSREIHSKP